MSTKSKISNDGTRMEFDYQTLSYTVSNVKLRSFKLRAFSNIICWPTSQLKEKCKHHTHKRKGSGGRGEENELSGTRPLATPIRERSSRSVGSRDGLSGSVELEAALRAVERNFLQPSLRRLLWASSASYNTHNNSLTQSLSNQCFRSGLNCLRQFHIG